jgi:hypothetical protein
MLLWRVEKYATIIAIPKVKAGHSQPEGNIKRKPSNTSRLHQQAIAA